MARKWHSEEVEPLGTWELPYEEASLLEKLRKSKKKMTKNGSMVI
jgi:hypothetical protein